MTKPDLSLWLASTTLPELRSLVHAKEQLDKLHGRRVSLEKELASVEKQIVALRRSLGVSPGKKQPSIARKPMVRRTSRPSIPSLIVEILQEKGTPLTVNQIADSLLNEKRYKTSSMNFKNQLRVLLYRNDRGLFRKVGAGEFGLADGPLPAAKGKTRTGAQGGRRQPAPPRKKAATRKQARSRKRVPRKKPVSRKPAASRPSPKASASGTTLQSLVVEIFRDKKKPLSLYEITGALLNEKKVQTNSMTFDAQVQALLNDPNGMFRPLKAGKFGLA